MRNLCNISIEKFEKKKNEIVLFVIENAQFFIQMHFYNL